MLKCIPVYLSQYSTSSVTKALVCAILCVWDSAYKIFLAAKKNKVAAIGFISYYLCGPKV